MRIVRAPLFCIPMSYTLGKAWDYRPDHLYLMKEHFAQSVNETEHLEYMESRGGNAYYIDRLLLHLVLIYY